MIYEVKDNIIYVYDKSQFDPKQILECGQVFRYGINNDGNYYVISTDKKATIIEKNKFYEIHSNDPDYFVNYFDLTHDYNIAKKYLSKFELLQPMIKFGSGIRLLNGDPIESIFSFTISQNNNIKRIQKIIEKLCEVGEHKDNYYAFPTLKVLSKQDFSFFNSLGAGYRDKFLYELSSTLLTYDINQICKKSTNEIYDFLISLKGVGPKVASCILLFGFSRREKFPVDTWIEQVYYNHFSSNKLPRPKIQEYFENIFGEFSGIAQQYLFYYERENKKH